MAWAAAVCLARGTASLGHAAGDAASYALGLAVAAQDGAPASLTAGDLISAITTAVNLGVLGVVFWLFVQGRLHSDSEIGRLTETIARMAADSERLVAERVRAEEQRDEALRVVRDQIAPALGSFVTTTTALLPLLQEVVRYRALPPRTGERY
jgi:hypothetical protein